MCITRGRDVSCRPGRRNGMRNSQRMDSEGIITVMSKKNRRNIKFINKIIKFIEKLSEDRRQKFTFIIYN